MEHRLFIVEGLPCLGKSTLSAYLADVLSQYGPVSFVDEGTGNHPADYEFHALAPAGMLTEQERVVRLSDYSAEIQERLYPFKIYDGLLWEKEAPVMLDKWRQFVRCADPDSTYVFNCVFLQNPMCETMMRFGFPEEKSRRYIAKIAEIIVPMQPVILYLKCDDVADAVRNAAKERPGWLEPVIAYHVNGVYGRSIDARGFDGYIACLEERQRRELRILSGLPVDAFVLDNPQRNWKRAEKEIEAIAQKCGG